MLRGKRRAAAATAGGVRILERKTGTHYAGHVVDLDAVQVLRAEHVNEHAHALPVEDEIAFARLLFNVEATGNPSSRPARLARGVPQFPVNLLRPP